MFVLLCMCACRFSFSLLVGLRLCACSWSLVLSLPVLSCCVVLLVLAASLRGLPWSYIVASTIEQLRPRRYCTFLKDPLGSNSLAFDSCRFKSELPLCPWVLQRHISIAVGIHCKEDLTKLRDLGQAAMHGLKQSAL